MNKLVKNYVYNLVYQIVVIIVPLITIPYLTRVLQPENLGIYTYVTSSASIINTIGILGLYNYGNRQIAYTRDNIEVRDKTFNELMSLRLFLCLFSSCIYFIWATQTEYTMYFIIYYPWLFASFIDVAWFFSGIEEMGTIVIKNLFIKLFSLIFIFTLVKNANDLYKYFYIVSVITLLACLSMFFQIRKKSISFKFSLDNSRNHLKDAILLFLPQLASLFYLQVDKIMIEILSGDISQLAFYDQAEKIINIPFTLITALSVVIMPRIANEFKKGNLNLLNDYIYKSARFSMMVSISMFFGINGIKDNFIPWYLGTEFLDVIQAVGIISPIILTNTLMNVSGTQYLTAINETKVLTISSVLAAIINVIANIILIPHMGFYGAAIATVISSFICVIVQLIAMNKMISIAPILCGLWKYFSSGIVMFVFLKIISVYLISSILNTLLLVIIGGGIYFTLLFILRDKYFEIALEIVGKFIKRR